MKFEDDLKTLSLDELKNIYHKKNTKDKNSKYTKKKYIELLTKYNKSEFPNIWITSKKIIGKGLEAEVLVCRKAGYCKEYVIKKFFTKSQEGIKKEIYYQQLAAKSGISPQVVDFNIKKKYIVMEKMDDALVVSIKKEKYILEKYQKQLITIFSKLDKLKIFYGDCNINNYMIKKDKLYIIDFGYSEKLDKRKHRHSQPNKYFMIKSIIGKLDSFGYDKSKNKLLIAELKKIMSLK